MSVYFARVGRYIKIGTSYDPQGRALSVFAGAGKPFDFEWRAPVEMLKVEPGNRREEREIHTALADYCAHGEWFFDSPPVRAFIESYRTPDARAAQLHRIEEHFDGQSCEHQGRRSA